MQDERIRFIDLKYSDRESLTAQLADFVREHGPWDYVIHNAGLTKTLDKRNFYRINAQNTANLIEALAASGCKPEKFLLMSSLSSYGRGDEKTFRPISLDDPQLPDTDYGKSKLAGEELFFEYGKECGAKVLVYRFPNLFGKWCRPNYNSAVATFCNNIANNLPIQVNDRATELELLYIDDLVEEMLDALEGKEHHCEYQELDPVADESGKYCYVPTTHKATLGEIVDLLEMFKNQPKSLLMPEIPNDSFAKKLYSTYLSYLPKEEVSFPLKMNVDDRGSFTELLKTANCGQFSVNISKPELQKENIGTTANGNSLL